MADRTNELTTLPGRIDTEDVADILKKAGLIAAGSLAGGFLKEKALKSFIKQDLWATVAELGLGTVVAAFALSKGPEALFYPSLGVAVHAAGNLISELLSRTGIVEGIAGTGGEGNGGGTLV
jgi:hypothetical protein